MRPMTDFSLARGFMVEGQVRPNRISDEKLVDAMRELPRENYAPDNLKPFAYSDSDLDLGYGRYLLAPLTIATLIQKASITENDSVLIIGCGTGYLSGLVGKLAGSVTAIDDHADFVELAEKNSHSAEILNVSFHTAGLPQGYPKMGPYSLIIIEGAVNYVPSSLTDQLEDGGRLITILNQDGKNNLALYRKIHNVVSHIPLVSLDAPLLPEFVKPHEFCL